MTKTIAQYSSTLALCITKRPSSPQLRLRRKWYLGWKPFAKPLALAACAAMGICGTSFAGPLDDRRSADAGLPTTSIQVEGPKPSIDGATNWLNSGALSMSKLKGKVVLVDFWTYSCINCIRTLPYIRAWSDKYKAAGLVVIGVHSPEFAFEKKVSNVATALERFDIKYPVAIDSDFNIWRSFENKYWPAVYLLDADGRVRYHQFGEGAYEETEAAIQNLLKEDGASDLDEHTSAPEAVAEEVRADFSNVRSAETYLGYREAKNFISTGGLRPDHRQSYSAPAPELNKWGLTGDWTVGSESAVSSAANAEIAVKFSARDLHLVAGPQSASTPIRFQVLIDGNPPGVDHGADIDEMGFGSIKQTRLYNLVRQRDVTDERTVTIRFLSAGAKAYVFTFG